MWQAESTTGSSRGCRRVTLTNFLLQGALLVKGGSVRRTRATLVYFAGSGMPGILTLKVPMLSRVVKNSDFQSLSPKQTLVVAGCS